MEIMQSAVHVVLFGQKRQKWGSYTVLVNVFLVSKLYTLQSILFYSDVHKKVKQFCGSLDVQGTSPVRLNEIRSIAGMAVHRIYSTWQICIVPTSVRRSGKWDIALELNDTRIPKDLSSLLRPTIRTRINP